MSGKKVRIGVFGGRRGQSLMSVLAHHGDAELVAVCDQHAPALEQCRRMAEDAGSSLACYEDFDRFLDHDMDAVVLANFATEHAPYAIRLLDSGRHVFSELMPCETMAEGVALVEAVERSGRIYGYGENCCFMPAAAEMRRLYRAGDLGEFLYAEGQYIHDCEAHWAGMTWGDPNHWRNWTPSTFYVTHSSGPIMWVTGTRPVRLTGYETPNVNRRRYGGLAGDMALVTCQMSNGGVFAILPWGPLKRDYLIWLALYGSKGAVELERNGSWTSLRLFRDDGSGARQYEGDYPPEVKAAAEGADHGGADFFPLHYWLQRILDRPDSDLMIDIYMALDMTFPGMLGYRSICEGNRPIDVPDFRNQEEREHYRGDNWSADPKKAGPGQPQSHSMGNADIPESLYAQQAAEFRKMTQS